MKQIISYSLFLVLLSTVGTSYAQNGAKDSVKPKSMYVTEAGPSTGAKKAVRRNLDEACFEAGVGAVVFTGGDDAPFGGGLGINIGMLRPKPKKHYALEYLLALDYCTAPSDTWYARSVMTTPANIESMSAGVNMNIGIAVSGIIINQHKLAVIVGPELMFQSMFLSSLKLKAGDTNGRDKVFSSFAPGIKASAFIGDKLMVNLEYSHSLKSEVSFDDYSNTLQTFNIPINVFNFFIKDYLIF